MSWDEGTSSATGLHTGSWGIGLPLPPRGPRQKLSAGPACMMGIRSYADVQLEVSRRHGDRGESNWAAGWSWRHDAAEDFGGGLERC